MKAIKVSIAAMLLASLSGCASNHHLVFFTNTTLGLEVASDPTGGSPAKFIFGYKRQEGVIDPLIPDYDFINGNNGTMIEPDSGDTNIIMTPIGTAIPKGSITKPHSVLAKMNFGATGGGTDAAAAQFFATGKAAELLAKAPGISGALSGDPKNNTITAIDFSKGHDTAVLAHLVDVYRMLTIQNNDDKAIEIKEHVDALDKDFFKITFKHYYWKNPTEINLAIEDYDCQNNIHEFPNVLKYLKTLNDSRNVAKEAVLKNGVITLAGPLTDAEKKQMINDIETFYSRYNEGKKLISSNKYVLDMIDYVYKNVFFETSTKEKGE